MLSGPTLEEMDVSLAVTRLAFLVVTYSKQLTSHFGHGLKPELKKDGFRYMLSDFPGVSLEQLADHAL